MASKNTVLLRNYDSPMDAHLMQATLGSHNIESTLTDVHQTSLGVGFGGVKLYVAPTDYDAAKGIMVALEENTESLSPESHSRNLRTKRTRRIIGAVLILILASQLMGLY